MGRHEMGSPQADRVNAFYDHFNEFLLAYWDPEHLHLGIFDEDAALEWDAEEIVRRRPAAIARLNRLLLDEVDARPSDVVVDAGSGVGGMTLLIAEQFGCTTIGLNLNRAQNAVAARRAAERGLVSRASFMWADVSTNMPLPDAGVDVIVNIESACHYEDRPAFLRECARILRPGGRLVATDWMTSETLTPEDRQMYIAPFEQAWALAPIGPLSSYVAMVEAAGFRVLDQAYLEDGIRPNGYIMRMAHDLMLLDVLAGAPTEDQVRVREWFGTFSAALLGGHFKVGHYVAEKPAREGPASRKPV